MKRVIVGKDSLYDDVFAMSQIVKRRARPEIQDLIPNSVYFSEQNASHGPRIKFYGGTAETRKTKDMPSLTFEPNSDTMTVEIADWMNRKNCPNAYDSKLVENLRTFLKMVKPILLLVWYERMYEADAMLYFNNSLSLRQILNDNGIYLDSYTMNRIDD